MNPVFINEVFPTFILPLGKFISDRQVHLMAKAAYVIPIIEMFAGLTLMLKPLRFISVPIVVIQHLIVIFLTGLSGQLESVLIWIWNLSMIFLVLLLYSGKTTERYFSFTHLLKQPVFFIIVVFYWILPAFSSKKMYPQSLSFSFYSGKELEAELNISEKTYVKLPYYLKHFSKKAEGYYVLHVSEWCMHELGVKPVSEKIIFENVKKRIQSLTGADEEDVKIVYITG